MRVYQTAEDLENALLACPPLRELLSYNPEYTALDDTRTEWLVKGEVSITKNLNFPTTRNYLKAYANDVQITRPRQSNMSSCMLLLNTGSANIFEKLMERLNRLYRMRQFDTNIRHLKKYNQPLPEGYTPFPPDRRRITSLHIHRYHLYGAYLVSMASLPVEPFIAPPQPEKQQAHPPLHTDNITQFPKRPEKPGT